MTLPALRHRLRQIPWLVSGLTGRFGQPAICPACGGRNHDSLAWKGFFQMLECRQCGLCHRFPNESATALQTFYDDGYAEPGLTTELPDDAKLAHLLASRFVDSGKDFRWLIERLQALGLKAGDRVLDYGANWGYCTWQLRQAGFDAVGYELSRPRAAYAAKLGVTVETNLDRLGDGFKMVVSCHVIEHVPDPRASLEQQLARVVPGGLVVAFTPNGSAAFRSAESTRWYRSWGQVHPVLLTDRFCRVVAADRPCLVTSEGGSERLARWNPGQQEVDRCDQDFLTLVLRRPD